MHMISSDNGIRMVRLLAWAFCAATFGRLSDLITNDGSPAEAALISTIICILLCIDGSVESNREDCCGIIISEDEIPLLVERGSTEKDTMPMPAPIVNLRDDKALDEN